MKQILVDSELLTRISDALLAATTVAVASGNRQHAAWFSRLNDEVREVKEKAPKCVLFAPPFNGKPWSKRSAVEAIDFMGQMFPQPCSQAHEIAFASPEGHPDVKNYDIHLDLSEEGVASPSHKTGLPPSGFIIPTKDEIRDTFPMGDEDPLYDFAEPSDDVDPRLIKGFGIYKDNISRYWEVWRDGRFYTSRPTKEECEKFIEEQENAASNQ